MRVIAFDPGEQTGYATGTIDGSNLVVEDFGWDRWMDAAYRFKRGAGGFQHVVYESWKLTPRGAKNLLGSDMPWSQFIGMMKMVAHDNQIDLTVYNPADKYWLDGILGTAWLPKGDVEHHRDAIRHLAIYALRKHGVRTIVRGETTVEVPSEVVSGGTHDGVPGV